MGYFSDLYLGCCSKRNELLPSTCYCVRHLSKLFPKLSKLRRTRIFVCHTEISQSGV